MRISEHDKTSIVELVFKIFGSKTQVKLFGSRADDARLGGDIDLLVIVPSDQLESAKNQKYKFLDELFGKIGEQKVDVIITTESKIHSDEFLKSLDGISL